MKSGTYELCSALLYAGYRGAAVAHRNARNEVVGMTAKPSLPSRGQFLQIRDVVRRKWRGGGGVRRSKEETRW